MFQLTLGAKQMTQIPSSLKQQLGLMILWQSSPGPFSILCGVGYAHLVFSQQWGWAGLEGPP